MLNKNDNIIVEQVENEYILFNSENNTIYLLNTTAYELWSRCVNCTKDEVLQDFVNILDCNNVAVVGIDTIRNECTHILDEFLSEGLIGE